MPALWHWKHLASSVSLPGASGNPGACGFGCCANAARDRSSAPSRASRALDERHKVVFTDALQHKESRRTFSAIGDQVRAARLDRVRVAGAEPDLLLGIAQEKPEVSLQHVERVLDIVVIVPGHLLGVGNLDLGDAETRPRSVLGPALDLVETVAVFHRFHGDPLSGAPFQSTRMPESCTTLATFAISRLISAANSAGVPGEISKPSAASLSRTPGVLKTFT